MKMEELIGSLNAIKNRYGISDATIECVLNSKEKKAVCLNKIQFVLTVNNNGKTDAKLELHLVEVEDYYE